ncbi:DUF1800 family protein [Flavobacteriaceae bacterium]|nr:DUF1800 family protein [Flavobacteriaceae bacterium]
MQQKRPNQEPPIDLVEQFYKENVDLKAIKDKRNSRKAIAGGIEKYTGEWGDAQKKHLLNRSLMGYAKYHLDDLQGLSLDEAIDLIFQAEELPLPINDYYPDTPQSVYDELNRNLGESEFKVEPVPPGETWVEAGFPGNSGPFMIQQSLNVHLLKNQLRQKTSIHWKLCFFLHNLLPTSDEAGASAKAEWQYNNTIFKSAFQSYKQTIIDISTDPNMLWYLNLQFSKVENPDENFAREIQELFTVGKGPNANYTESDVKAFAKIFVGWESDFLSHEKPGEIKTRFSWWNHDSSDKQLSSFYGNKLIRGRNRENGAEEFYELIDIIFENEELPLYICRRLYQFFLYPDIDDNAEKNIIIPMAKIFSESEFSLVEPLKLLFKSEHFFDSNNFNSLIKSPIEFVYGGLKSLDLHKADFYTQIKNYKGENNYEVPEKYTNPITRDFYFYRRFITGLEMQGCCYFKPPNVSGWPSYYQAPVFDLFWINSKTISNRAQFGQDFKWGLMIDNDSSNDYSYIKIDMDYTKIIQLMEQPGNLEKVVDQFLERFMTVDIGIDQKNDLMQVVLNGVSPSHYTEIYNRYASNPSEYNRIQLNVRFRDFIPRLFMMSEIHLF